MSRIIRTCGLIAAVAVILTAGSSVAQSGSPANDDSQRLSIETPDAPLPWKCATGEPTSGRMAAANGEVIRAEGIPTVIPGNYRGPLTAVFEVMGDHASIDVLQNLTAPGRQTVPRTSSGAIAGRIYSRFETTVQVDLAANWRASGHDSSSALTFTATLDGQELPARARVYLAASYVPRSIPTTRISDDLQYSAHVVNRRTRDDIDLDFTGAELRTKKWFYQQFEDTYDSLVIVPVSLDRNFGSQHEGIRTPIAGTGRTTNRTPFGATDEFGSTLLQNIIHLKTLSSFTLLHEIAHQWGDHWNWPLINGIAKLDGGHPPLWGLFESPLSYRLDNDQYLAVSGDAWTVAVDGDPTFSPLDLYAMGRLSAENVPVVDVLENPDQQPRLGGRATGATKRVTIDDIVRVHGKRSGPVVERWRTAFVVVSVDRLLNSEELAYFDYFAQRASDPNGQEWFDYTFQKMTGAALDTRIYPRDGGAVPPNAYRPPAITGNEASSFFRLDSELPLVWNRRERFDIRGSFERDYYSTTRPDEFRARIMTFAGSTVLTTPATRVNSSGAFSLPVDVGSLARGAYRVEFQAAVSGGGFNYRGVVPRVVVR